MKHAVITAQVEQLNQPLLEELKGFFPSHAVELDTYADRRPLMPDYEEYWRRDRVGQLLLVTVRRDGALIGYFVGFIVRALHYQSTLTCMQDIFFIAPEARDGSPRAALKLFEAVTTACKKRGVKEIRLGCKLAHDTSVLFAHLGAIEVERIWSLWLENDHA